MLIQKNPKVLVANQNATVLIGPLCGGLATVGATRLFPAEVTVKSPPTLSFVGREVSTLQLITQHNQTEHTRQNDDALTPC